MALTIDIKTNNGLEKSALATASALDRVAASEEKVNALAGKTSLAYASAAKNADALAKYTEVYGKRTQDNYGDTKRLADVGKKDRSKMLAQVQAAYAVEKKVVDVEKKKKEEIKKGATAYAVVAAGVTAAAAAAVAFGVAIAGAAKSAYDSKREAAALIDAFTGHRGPEALRKLDVLAQSLGASVEDVRAKFVEFRQAGLSNDLSGRLIKMRADLMAVGLSASAADKEISAVTSAADGIYNLGAERKLAAIALAYKGTGSGALAAAAALTTLQGAENRLGNVASDELAKVWKQIGPEIGKAANALADFAIKALKSEGGQKAIASFVDAVKSVTSAVGPAIDGVGKLFNFLDQNKVGVITALAGAVTALGIALAVSFGPAIVAATAAALAVAALPVAIAAAAVAIGAGVQAIFDNWDTLKQASFADFKAWGGSLVDGLAKGITDGATKALDAVTGLAKDVAGAFADALGIHSPSKLFADFGKNTVVGFRQGQEEEIGSSSKGMPLEREASQPPEMPPPQRSAEQPLPAAAPRVRTESSSGGGTTITIENLNVQSDGGDAEDIAKAIRRELQLLLQAGAISRGLA